MIGVIDVGGGTRGIYSAGVLDFCIDNEIHFDYGIGISAGSSNIISYATGQRGRSYKFYTEYAFRKEYMSLKNFIRKKNYIDLDYVFGVLSKHDGEYPIDYKKYMDNPMDCNFVATDSKTGETYYFKKNDVKYDNFGPLKESSSIPILNKPYGVYSNKYFDGGIGDPIPLKKAFVDGCTKVVLILTRPKDFYREEKADHFAVNKLKKVYPKLSESYRERENKYNLSLDIAKKYEEEGKVLIIAPDSIANLKTLTKDINAMKELYIKGYND